VSKGKKEFPTELHIFDKQFQSNEAYICAPYFCVCTFYYSFQKVGFIKATAVLALPYETTDFSILQVFLSWSQKRL
jgi:hypothetical protein